MSENFKKLIEFFQENNYHYSFAKDKKGCFAYMEIFDNAKKQGYYFSLSGFDYNYHGSLIKAKDKNGNSKLIGEIKNITNKKFKYAPLKNRAVVPFDKAKEKIGELPALADICDKDFISLSKMCKKLKTEIGKPDVKIINTIKDLYNCCEKMLVSVTTFKKFQEIDATMYIKWKPCEKRGCDLLLNACSKLNVYYLFEDYNDYTEKNEIVQKVFK